MKQELERLFWILGAVLILPFLIQQGVGLSSSDGKPGVAELRSIPVMQPAVAATLAADSASARHAAPQVQTLGLSWERDEPRSIPRLADQTDSIEQAIGTLFIPALGVQVPVFANSDEITLALGAGIIPGTNLYDTGLHDTGLHDEDLQGVGSIGLASHPDGYFRHLKSVNAGDLLLLKTRSGLRQFQVVETRIMALGDNWTPTAGENVGLTLVTCYPSYEGTPPQRVVVSAREVRLGTTATAIAPRQVAGIQALDAAWQKANLALVEAHPKRIKF